jgi:hypothetical protein
MGVKMYGFHLSVLLEFRNEMLGFLIVELVKSLDVDKTRRTERPGFLHNHYSELVEGEIVESGFGELGHSLSESLSRAFPKGRIVLLIYVVLDCDQLVAWSVVVGEGDVDTSMFLRTVASPETLNG